MFINDTEILEKYFVVMKIKWMYLSFLSFSLFLNEAAEIHLHCDAQCILSEK